MNVYEIKTMAERLAGNTYPGRGIVLGVTPDGTQAVAAYFIMGRSVNSRNRVFVREPDGIRTEAHDPSLMKDPHLIIYHPVREVGQGLIVTNGDQTDTVWECGDFRRALMTRTYEPDEPNWTPRISALLREDGSFELSILKRQAGRCLREFFCYEGCEPGCGYFLSTNQGDGNPLPSFDGEPIPVTLPEPEQVWQALNTDNKVSLYTNVHGTVHLFNKHLGD